MSAPARTYRFGDAAPPGVLLGLPLRQAVPVIGGIVWLAVCLQTPLSIPGGLVGLVAGFVVAFGRWRGSPVLDTFGPAVRIAVAGRTGRRTWHRSAMLGAGDHQLPPVLDGLEIIEGPATAATVSGAAPRGMAVVRDRRRHLLTAAVCVSGRGFPLAAAGDQDRMLAGWGAALSPFARPRSPVTQVTWQAWSGPADLGEQQGFLAATGVTARAHDGGSDASLQDYLALVDQQAQATRVQRVLVTVTIDERRARRQGHASRLDAGIDALTEEVGRFRQRLEAAGLMADTPLDPPALTATVRLRSDPTRAAQLATLTRSLAAAAGRGAVEWGPMTVEAAWGQVRVDGSVHRTYRVAGWPQLPVPADWLGALLDEPTVTRTVCVVMEPVPITQSARAADREAMAREADADAKGRRGFRITALDRQRLSRVEDRERELAEGHAEFRFTGLVDVCAPDPGALDDVAGAIEQAAAQSLIDLRPLDARHDQAWVACLPLGRNLATRGGLR